MTYRCTEEFIISAMFRSSQMSVCDAFIIYYFSSFFVTFLLAAWLKPDLRLCYGIRLRVLAKEFLLPALLGFVLWPKYLYKALDAWI